jgi:hypothetical protein
MDDDEYVAHTVLLSVLPMYRAATTLCVLFLPKLYIAIVRTDKNVLPSSMVTQRGSGRSTMKSSSRDNVPTAGNSTWLKSEIDNNNI